MRLVEDDAVELGLMDDGCLFVQPVLTLEALLLLPIDGLQAVVGL